MISQLTWEIQSHFVSTGKIPEHVLIFPRPYCAHVFTHVMISQLNFWRQSHSVLEGKVPEHVLIVPRP